MEIKQPYPVILHHARKYDSKFCLSFAEMFGEVLNPALLELTSSELLLIELLIKTNLPGTTIVRVSLNY